MEDYASFCNLEPLAPEQESANRALYRHLQLQQARRARLLALAEAALKAKDELRFNWLMSAMVGTSRA